MRTLIILFALGLTMTASAQVAFNETGASADPSAILDISSTTMGVLPPKMNQAQRLALTNGVLTDPPQGTFVYQTGPAGTEGYYYWNGSTWSLLNHRDQYWNSILMSAVPSCTGPIDPLLPCVNGSTPAPDLEITSLGVGKMLVNHPVIGSPGAVPTIIATPEYLTNGTPPVGWEDYCTASFTGMCNGASGAQKRSLSQIAIVHPAGNVFMGLPYSVQLAHCYQGTQLNSCANGDIGADGDPGNYNSYLLSGPAVPNTCGPPFTAPTNPLGAASNGYGAAPVTAGSDVDLFCSASGGSITIFADWNMDGDFFDDPGGPMDEQLVATPSLSGAAWAGAAGAAYRHHVITIPAGAFNGPISMRTIVSPFGPTLANPCMISTVGSTRDYQINVTGGVPPVLPGENRLCNVTPSTPYTNSFTVECWDMNGNFANDKIQLLIKGN